jgi:predicted nucleotidyltransferase
MRLSNEEKHIITSSARSHFGSRTRVILFGSRAIDTKKGGDIDLLIIPENYTTADDMFTRKIKMLVDLELNMGEQKIDIIIKSENNTRSIVKTALKTGVRLC